MLTQRQLDMLRAIDDRITATGVCPSLEELGEACGLQTRTGVKRLISGLEERGFIRRLPFRARALEVIRKPPARYRAFRYDRKTEKFEPL